MAVSTEYLQAHFLTVAVKIIKTDKTVIYLGVDKRFGCKHT